MERHHETLPLADKDRPGRCVWCYGPTAWAGVGRRPVYCGRSCRQRAYEVRRAAGAGLVAKDVVHVQQPAAEQPPPAPAPSRSEQLYAIARALEDGRLYDRDLAQLAEPLRVLTAAYERRVRARYRIG